MTSDDRQGDSVDKLETAKVIKISVECSMPIYVQRDNPQDVQSTKNCPRDLK
jgi:hypothetical protein